MQFQVESSPFNENRCVYKDHPYIHSTPSTVENSMTSPRSSHRMSHAPEQKTLREESS